MAEKKKQPQKKSKGESFFNSITNRDVRTLQKRTFSLYIVKDIVFIIIIGFLVIWLAAKDLQPVPVIVTNAETGQVRVVKETLAPDRTNDIMVKHFTQRFIELYSSQDPDIAINLSKAYGMMTPSLAKIFEKERKDAEKPKKWFDKNVKSDFFIDKIKIRGDYKVDGELAVIGTGSFFFRPAVGFDGDYSNFKKFPAFFQAKIKVVSQNPKMVYGLLMDYYKIDYFEDRELLEAFLLKAKIDFNAEDTGVNE